MTGVLLRGRLAAAAALASAAVAGAGAPPLRVAVSDPLAIELACPCVAGYAQRDYRALGEALASELGRPVEVAFAATVEEASRRAGGPPDLMVGKASVVEAELARAEGRAGRCLARLTDVRGGTVFHGVLVARADDPAEKVADARGYRLVLGPSDSEEKHGAALALMRAYGYVPNGPQETADNCTLAARRVAEAGAGTAAFVSDYALPLLVGCGVVDAGGLKVLGGTGPVPFIAAYATGRLSDAEAAGVKAALLKVGRSARLRKRLESRDGFVPAEALPSETSARSAEPLPSVLPARPEVRWRRPLHGQSLGGLAVAEGRLLVTDKDEGETADLLLCLDAESGAERWTLAYPAAARMDYTSAPRATPVVAGGLVYLQGALGDLTCAELSSGRVVWRLQLHEKYGGKRPTWGFCGTPLLVGDRVVVQAASEEASLVALDRLTGREVWRAAGEGPGYGSLVHLYLGGRWQIVGHEARTLCGWEPESGRLLWRVTPPESNDFNVPTPLRVGDLLLAATENNGTRLYGFDAEGRARPQPLFASDALSPQIATPVRVGDTLWGHDEGCVCALRLGGALRLAGRWEDDALKEYASLVEDGSRVLAVTKPGALLLFDAAGGAGAAPQRARAFDGDAEVEVWSSPALSDGRLYVRAQDCVECLQVGEPSRRLARAGAGRAKE